MPHQSTPLPGFSLCRVCGLVLPVGDFYPNRTSKNNNGLQYRCKACFKAYGQANKERIRERQRQWEHDHREHLAKKRAERPPEVKERDQKRVDAWHAENAERVRQIKRSYYERNQETVKAKTAATYLERRATDVEGYRAERRARWQRSSKTRSWFAARRAKKRDSTAQRVDLDQLVAEHGMVCHLCGTAIADRSDLHFDHVIPLARGGTHTADNIRPAHAACNQRKGAKLITHLPPPDSAG